jgi:hypothetical protein
VNLSLHAYRNLPPADKIKFIVVLHVVGILLIALGFLLGLSFRQRRFQQTLPTPQVAAAPTFSLSQFIPLTGNCTTPTLVLGTKTFQIQNLTRGAEGSLAVPRDTAGIAYRVDGSGNPVFVLSPTPQNITVMETIEIGSIATLTAPDCGVTTYIVSAPQAGSLNNSAFESGPVPSITVFFPTVFSGEGFLYKGQLAGE